MIVRGPRPEHHKADFHDVIVCSRKHTAVWEAGDTHEGATVYVNMDPPNGNWLLVRYKGYEIAAFRPRYFTLFDGVESEAISKQDYIKENHLKRAVWWSDELMPESMKQDGVGYATDDFSKRRIIEDPGACRLPYAKMAKLKQQRKDKFHDSEPDWLIIGVRDVQGSDTTDGDKSEEAGGK